MPPQIGTPPLGTTPLGGAGAGPTNEEVVTFLAGAALTPQSNELLLASVTLLLGAGLLGATHATLQDRLTLQARASIVPVLPGLPSAYEETLGFLAGVDFEARTPSAYEETVLFGVAADLDNDVLQSRQLAKDLDPGVRNMVVTVGRNMRVS